MATLTPDYNLCDEVDPPFGRLSAGMTPGLAKKMGMCAERAHGVDGCRTTRDSRCQSMQAADHDDTLAAGDRHLQARFSDQGHRSPAVRATHRRKRLPCKRLP